MKKCAAVLLAALMLAPAGCSKAEKYPYPVDDAPAGGAETPCLVENGWGENIIADYIVLPGAGDRSADIQTALDGCAAAGGGTVWLPAGKYELRSGVRIPSFVTLAGDRETVIHACVESSDSSLPALFLLGGSGGVYGLTVYYPAQDAENVLPYPFTFYADGQGDRYMLQSVRRVRVINGYRGLGACVEESGAHEMLTVEDFSGTFLFRAAEVYNQADVGTWKDINISNDFWKNAPGGMKCSAPAALDAYTAGQTALVLGDLEWTEFLGVSVSGYDTAVRIVKGKRIEFAGSFYGLKTSDCRVGIEVESLDRRWGMLVAASDVAGSEFSMRNLTRGVIKTADVRLTGPAWGEYSSSLRLEDNPGAELSAHPAPGAATTPRISRRLYAVGDISELAGALAAAGETGGVVYLPAGVWRLEEPVSVPSGVELRGAGLLPTRDQGGNSAGTVILTDYPGELITLSAYSGIGNIRIFYDKNTPVVPGKEGTAELTGAAVKGAGREVWAVNVCIAAAGRGIDFSGCDGHLVKNCVFCCWEYAVRAGGEGGRIEGCLQNGTVLTRNALPLEYPVDEASQLFPYVFDALTRRSAELIVLENARGERVYDTFAYGVRTFARMENCEDVFMANIGADNLGGTMLVASGTSGTLVNIMRWNGRSAELDEGSAGLVLLNRLTIENAREKRVN